MRFHHIAGLRPIEVIRLAAACNLQEMRLANVLCATVCQVALQYEFRKEVHLDGIAPVGGKRFKTFTRSTDVVTKLFGTIAVDGGIL